MENTAEYENKFRMLEKIEGMQFLRRREYISLRMMMHGKATTGPELAALSTLTPTQRLFPAQTVPALACLREMGFLSSSFKGIFILRDREIAQKVLSLVDSIDGYGLMFQHRTILRYTSFLHDRAGQEWIGGELLYHSLDISKYVHLKGLMRKGLVFEKGDKTNRSNMVRVKEEHVEHVKVWKEITEIIKKQRLSLL